MKKREASRLSLFQNSVSAQTLFAMKPASEKAG
jgi:hypothetical protein